jgi:ATP-dependent Clp protease ATP-binding subunit ClpA
MIGAGGQAGQNDAANLLKPALARGELRTIAATTWSEYKKYFEKDAALARRFQVVKVEEPSEPQCLIMMRGWWLRWKSITTSAFSMRRSTPASVSRIAISPAASCQTRQ